MITERPERVTPDGDGDGGGAVSGPRRPHSRRRPTRPSGRALVGGLLVAGAALGSLLVATAGTGPAEVPVVVADGTIEVGDPLGTANLRVAQMALPAELVDGTYDDPTALAGTVARSRLDDGELLQSGDVIESTSAQRAAAPAREFALRLDTDRVVAGRLEAGDAVDVIATYGTGADAVTVVVLHDSAVLSVQSNDDALGSARTILLTLALDDRASAVSLAHAVDVAALNVVRTTTSAPDDSGLEPYRPSIPERDR